MRRKFRGVVERLARGWRLPDATITWLQVQVEWIRLYLGDNE